MLDACNVRVFHIIAAVKANRKICLAGIQVPMSDFVANTCVMKISTPWQWRANVTGSLHTKDRWPRRRISKLLLSWEEKLDNWRTPFCILCTDLSLDVVTILTYYRTRWHIETGYRYFKELLGFDPYQLLSSQGISRLWAIQFLVQNLLEFQRHEWSSYQCRMSLGDVVRRFHHE